MGLTQYSYLHTTVHKDLNADSTGEVVGSADTVLFGFRADNSENGAPSYVKFYDQDTAPDENAIPVLVARIAANGTRDMALNMGLGLKFTSGVSVRCVTAGGTGGTTDPASGPVPVTVFTS
jgi:hypothetical protein